MDGYVRKLKRAAIVYWAGVWATIIGVMLIKASPSPAFGVIVVMIGYVAVLSGLFVAGLYYIVKRVSQRNKVAVIFSCWVGAPFVFIIVIMEVLMSIISGRILGIDAIRRETLPLLLISSVWSLITFFVYLRGNKQPIE